MSNWCDVEYAFIGEKEEVKSFRNKLEKYTSDKFEGLKNDFGSCWEGNIAFGFGLDYAKIACRGEIEYISEVSPIDDNDFFVFYVSASDAWQPNYELFEQILLKFYSGTIGYEMIAEEVGCELYINTDTSGKFFPTRYRINLCKADDSIVEEAFANLEDVNRFISKEIGEEIHFDNTEDIEKYIEDQFEWVYVYKYAEE